ERSLGAGPGAENGLDQFFGCVRRWRDIFGSRERGLLELNRLPVAVEVGDAPGAFGQMLLKLGALLGGQVAGQIFVQELGKLAAVHRLPSRKCGSSSERKAWRARWSRVLTSATLVPSARAVSSVAKPSMSRSSKTIRYVSGS